MPARPLCQLGEEPIYCEAVHDPVDDVYSGSDNDHYEGPLHRRLHIEKKAIDFLAGHVPILLSAKLRGPFDSQHWNNPWRSRRAERQAALAGTQTTWSNLPVESARGHASDQVPEDVPNTQGTSLYPLPSPEITNPPSARKNPYMEEEEYNRVKTWREAVKGNSISKDPFWLSQHDDSDNVSITRKRPANRDWLHTRESKKRKFSDMRKSPPEGSPSQAAAKARRHQIRQPSQLTIHSTRTSSAHEDELATGVNTKNANVASRVANKNTSTPRSRRIERRSPHGKLRLQEAGSSEDELSMPSTTHTHRASRSCVEQSRTPKGDGSPSRRPTRKSTYQPRSGREKAEYGRTQVEKIEASQLSARQSSSIEAARKLSKDAARMAIEASGSVGNSPGQGAAQKYKPIQTEKVGIGSVTENPKPYAELLADIALSQQDSSFCFHTRTKSPVQISAPGPLPNNAIDGTTPNSPPIQSHVAAAAVGRLDSVRHALCDDDEDVVAPNASNSADVEELEPNAKQQTTNEIVNESTKIVDAQVIIQIQPAGEATEREETPRKVENDKIDDPKGLDVTPADDKLEAMVDGEVASDLGKVHELESNSEVVTTETPQAIAQDEGCAPSDPEWSTCLDTQDLISMSATTTTALEHTHGITVVEQGVYDPSDSDWTSCIDTQDLPIVGSMAGVVPEESQSIHNIVYQGPNNQADPRRAICVNTQDSLEEKFLSEEAGDVPVIEQDPNGPSNPEWSTYSNTQAQFEDSEFQHENTESEYEDTLDVDFNNPANCMPIVEDDDDSISEWSTYATSQVDTDQTGDSSREPVPSEAPQHAKPSKASVGSIIDAYVDAETPLGLSSTGENSIVRNEYHQDSITSVSGPGAVEAMKPGQERGEPPMEVEEAKADSVGASSDDIGIFDKTATSIEPQQLTDDGMLDGTMSSIEPRQIRSQTIIDLQMPQAAEHGANAIADPGFLDQATASLEPPHLQSPWAEEVAIGLLVLQSAENETKPNTMSNVVEVTTSIETLEIQSPWTEDTGNELHQPAAQAAPNGSSSTLDFLAGKQLPFSQPPQSPWTAHTPAHFNPPSSDFAMSIKAFSDFATPSPTKKRASFNGSILRDRFKTPVFQKPRRQVHFAPLPGEDESGNMDIDQKGDDTIYVEEDVYKTGPVRVPRPITRAASPPPKDVSPAEVGGLLDQDSKFAKHFEAMAKRKKSPRKTLKLLPSDSQQAAAASPGVGAMAEAFIQASQTRRKALEMAESDEAAEAKVAGEGDDLPVVKSSSPVAMDTAEGQENVEPVDDVSAVLDNLGEFLDNTWGVALDVGEQGADYSRAQPQPKTPQGKKDARGIFDTVGDPMVALNVNVWAQ